MSDHTISFSKPLASPQQQSPLQPTSTSVKVGGASGVNPQTDDLHQPTTTQASLIVAAVAHSQGDNAKEERTGRAEPMQASNQRQEDGREERTHDGERDSDVEMCDIPRPALTESSVGQATAEGGKPSQETQGQEGAEPPSDQQPEENDNVEHSEHAEAMNVGQDVSQKRLLAQFGNIRLTSRSSTLSVDTNPAGCAVGPDSQLLSAEQINFNYSPSSPTMNNLWTSVSGGIPGQTFVSIIESCCS